nr:hypothetical protein GCM10020092_019210 [Actinoplanes digitatis]
MSTTWAVTLSLLLLAGNAFFVAAEFALVASKRYRLEHAAAEGSRAARAALEGSRELSLMLARRPARHHPVLAGPGRPRRALAIEHLVHPLLHTLGLPDVPSEIIAFLFALTIVTFLHLVIGEMMPKSWAITDPERSATLLALPFRGYVRLVRPALLGLNVLANAALKPFGVHPQDQLAQAHGPQEMHILLERSRAEGLIGAEQTELLTSMLKLQETKVADVLIPDDQLVTVAPQAAALDIEAASLSSGRSRLAVVSETSGEVVGVVHVRDAVRVTTAGRDATAADLMDPPFLLDALVTVTDAVTQMRAARVQLAIVVRGSDRVGFVALEDLLEQVIGEFDDETDPVPVGSAHALRGSRLVFKRVLRAFGVGGPTVDTVLPDPTGRPGGRLTGEVRIAGGDYDVVIDNIVLSLVTRVEAGDGDALLEFHRASVAEQLHAGRRRAGGHRLPALGAVGDAGDPPARQAARGDDHGRAHRTVGGQGRGPGRPRRGRDPSAAGTGTDPGGLRPPRLPTTARRSRTRRHLWRTPGAAVLSGNRIRRPTGVREVDGRSGSDLRSRCNGHRGDPRVRQARRPAGGGP